MRGFSLVLWKDLLIYSYVEDTLVRKKKKMLWTESNSTSHYLCFWMLPPRAVQVISLTEEQGNGMSTSRTFKVNFPFLSLSSSPWKEKNFVCTLHKDAHIILCIPGYSTVVDSCFYQVSIKASCGYSFIPLPQWDREQNQREKDKTLWAEMRRVY